MGKKQARRVRHLELRPRVFLLPLSPSDTHGDKFKGRPFYRLRTGLFRKEGGGVRADFKLYYGIITA